jgi:hypothetical protein
MTFILKMNFSFFISFLKKMELIRKLIADQGNFSSIIKNIRKPEMASMTWTELDGYILGISKHITKREFDSVFTSKKSLEKYPDSILLNDTNECLSGRWISQPFGSQRFPDFLGFEKSQDVLKLFYIECKTSNTSKATWNCSLPVPQIWAIYPFYNKKTHKLKICSGLDLITEISYNKLKPLMTEIRQKNEEIDKLIAEETGDSWQLYLRPMWNSKKEHPNNTTDILKYIN